MHRAATGALLATLALIGLAGCGGSASSTIAGDAKTKYAAAEASCSKVGIMLFVGKRADVYDCRLSGVDVAHRPVDHLESGQLERCFVRTSGATFDVTPQIVALQKLNDQGFACA